MLASFIRHGGTRDDVLTESKSLPYLEAIVRKRFRMHPPIIYVVPKKVPIEDNTFIINGKENIFPSGTKIGYNAWGLHHNKKIFGEDADYFRTERWLLDEHNETHQERLNAMIRITEMVFGYGKYQCLGKPIAWLDIRKVIFEFLQQFDWFLANSEKPWRSLNYSGIFLQDQMWALFTERKPNSG